MTEWKYILCAVVLGLCFCNGFTTVDAKSLLGAEHCTWGPSYWCSNLTNAKNCRAVRHCIQTVWEKQNVPEDNDDICKICVDMVKQARDQLESNQTQADLKAVFEGSCNLIPIKVVREECISLADNFVPELVETLSSEMNPQVVCSVAGLCNSARIDKMLEEMKNNAEPIGEVKPVEDKEAMCKGCNLVANKMKQNFDSLTYDEFLEKIIRGCGKLGSFSDSCSGLVFSHFEDIYSHMKNEFNSDNVCHLAGACSMRFHEHEDETGVVVEIKPSGDTGKITNGGDDNLPCAFCEKLVNHLREILIANTTDIEFKRVLEGICKQTKSFSKECLSIVDQYFVEIYNYFVEELDPEGVCFMAGICQKGVKEVGSLAPLLPAELVIKAIKPIKDQQLIGTDERNSYKPLTHVGLKKSEANVKVISPESAQLPIERMMVTLPENKAVCTFCQYFLHYLQVEISDSTNEQKIKDIVENACKKLPNSITEECDSFVNAYGNAVIAMLVQRIDPANVCPSVGLCPNQEVKNVEILMTGASGDKPNCPLCLFAIQQLETMLQNNKTKENVQNALDRLCNYLSVKLRPECTSFVDAYYKQLVDVVVADFTPQEVCTYLKLCSPTKPSLVAHHQLIDSYFSKKTPMADHNNFRQPMLPISMLANGHNGDIETNEIPDNTVNGVPMSLTSQLSSDKAVNTPGCVVCEWVVTKLDKLLANKKTDEEIKTIVRDACSYLPKNITQECNTFVDKYADLVITLLTQDMKPQQVCNLISMCAVATDMKDSVLDCAVCEESVYIIEKILDNPNVDHKLEHIIEKTCYGLPSKYYDRCVRLIKTYGESIIHLLATLPDSHSVCSKIGLCGEGRGAFIELSSGRTKRSHRKVGENHCTWGPTYWCDNYENAGECKALQHCQERVWLAAVPPPKKTSV